MRNNSSKPATNSSSTASLTTPIPGTRTSFAHNAKFPARAKTLPSVVSLSLLLALGACSDSEGTATNTPGPGLTRPSLTGAPDKTFTTGMQDSVDFVNNGGAPVACELAEGQTLPDGLSLKVAGSTCQIAGAPGASLVKTSYTVIATNSAGNSMAGIKIAVTAASQTQIPVASSDTLVWSDEFDGNTLDTSNWDIQMGDGCPALCGWGNSEQQSYTDNPNNLRVRDGFLELIATRSGSGFNSARIRTAGKRSFKFPEGGTLRIEARMTLPGGQGLWPAFWMLPEDFVHGIWPQSGEIDIMEARNLGVNGRTVTSYATHYGAPWPNNFLATSETENEASPMTEPHVFAIEWEQGEIRWYINDKHVHTQTGEHWYSLSRRDGLHRILKDGAPFDEQFHLLLNVAVGGDFPGKVSAETSFPQTMRVDWVRVYSCGTDATNSRCHEDASVVANDFSEPGYTNGTTATIDSINIFTDGPQTFAQTKGGQSRSVSFAAQAVGEGASVNTDAMDGNDQVAEISFTDSGSSVEFVAPGTGGNTNFNVIGGWYAGQLEFDLRVIEVAAGSSIQARIVDANNGYLHRGFTNAELNQIKNSASGRKTQVLDLGLLGLAGGFSYADITTFLSLRAFGAFAESARTVIQVDDIRLHIPCVVRTEGEGPECRADITDRVSVANPRGNHPAVSLDVVTDTTAYPNSQNVYIDAIDTASGLNEFGVVPAEGEDITSATEVEVAGRGKVLQCSVAADQAVCGIVAGIGRFADWSAYSNGGILEFDLRILTPPEDSSADMLFKYEADSQRNADVILGSVASLIADGAWRRVRIDLTSKAWKAGNGSQYNLGHVHGFHLLPSWGRASGAVWQLDDVVLYRP